MNKGLLISILLVISCNFPLIIQSQQAYVSRGSTGCESRNNSNSVVGYACNGVNTTCQAYLTFRAQPPYNSISNISTLLAVDSSQLSGINSLPQNMILRTNRMLLIPVTCSCSGQHYQVNISYTVQRYDTYYTIAKNTFQGLSTCQAIQVQNCIPALHLFVGAGLTVPLRCACPTQAQSDGGVKYLLSYVTKENEDDFSISRVLGVNRYEILEANGLSDIDSDILPYTTLLVPFKDPPTSTQLRAPPGSSRTWIYAVGGAVGGLLLVGAMVFCVFFCKQKKEDKPHYEKEAEKFLVSISSITQSIKVYTFEQLKAATVNFSPSCLIKGSVYRGTINNDFAAIKIMIGDVTNEINLLNKINHVNLIRLLGVSFNERSCYLVYEYMSNGPLSDWIHRKKDRKILNWKERQQILLDVATGLNYLHSHASPPHIHKDLNSTNILLDHNLRAKIANFGQARSPEGQYALTRHIVGTRGYMAPEYLTSGIISPKFDVYAFGVLMFEILTGNEASLFYKGINEQFSLLPEGGGEYLAKLMDPMLQGNYHWDLALVLFRMMDDCLKKDPSNRPNMDDIFQSLSTIWASTMSEEWSIIVSEPCNMPR